MIRSFNGKTPRIAETAFISEAAYVIGDVEIGEHSSIWPGAVVRGDVALIKIGNNSQIEDNCVVHSGETLLIGDNVHIGHSVVIHCARIGNDVLIGNHATVLDNVEIGNSCIIAAHSLVSERKKIPDESFIAGVPAEVKGKSTQAQLSRLSDGVKYYIKLAAEYKRQGL